MIFVLLSMVETIEDKFIFAKFYNQYKDASMLRALKILNDNAQDAEEAFQNAWFQIAKNFSKIKKLEEQAQSTYVLKTVEYKAINIARSNIKWEREKKRTEVAPGEEISDDALYSICAEEDYKTIVEILENMEETYRDVLMLYYLHGLSIGDIAEHMGLNKKTVYTRFYRGKEILKEKIRERGLCDE